MHGPMLSDELGMCSCLRSIHAGGKAALAISAGRHPEAPAKRPAERFVALEAAGKRDIQHRLVADKEHHRGAAEPKPQRVLLGRFPGGAENTRCR